MKPIEVLLNRINILERELPEYKRKIAESERKSKEFDERIQNLMLLLEALQYG